MSGEYCDEDVTLDMDIEINDEECDSDSDSDIDEDDGEIGEFYDENEQIDDGGDGETNI